MKLSIYPKLALDGIRKNKRLYFPYILTGSVMVIMYYILSFLCESPTLDKMKGGSVIADILPLGCAVIAVFSLMFLFYTNSFLIKQRYREFGLYNILGMDKKNVCKIMAYETIFTGAIVIFSGVFFGIVFSKVAELILFNLLKLPINYDLTVSADSISQTTLIYCGIYLVLLLNSIIRVFRSKPLELVQSIKAGEKVPQKTWIFALIGVLTLAAAYYLAVSIEEPITTLVWFFVAVILVIIGTYLLFIAGSVVICKLLQKSKNYYYKENHFVSVSSMVYRMKRNGAGLASICVLLTMVLVMISSTACLYFGQEDALNLRCPNSINISATFNDFYGISDENINKMRAVIREYSGDTADLTGVRACDIQGLITENGMEIDALNNGQYDFSTDEVGYLSAISLSDYNILMNENKTLKDDECLIYCNRLKLNANTFTLQHSKTYKVNEYLKDFKVDGDTLVMTAPVIYIVIKDLNEFALPYKDLKNTANEPIMTYDWRCGFDIDDPEFEEELSIEVHNKITETAQNDNNRMFLQSYSTASREEKRASFFDMYGSLFFLGIMLSLVFSLAAVLIIYYKQICEGYEDYPRFEIMQKIGMTKRGIKKSINSQMLTIFFSPLLLAGVHLAFAFPLIKKILLMFAFNNIALSVFVNFLCFAVLGIMYAFIYKLTSGSYFAIVSGRKNG